MASAPALQYARPVGFSAPLPPAAPFPSLHPPIPSSYAAPSLPVDGAAIAARAAPEHSNRLHKKSIRRDERQRQNHVAEVSFHRTLDPSLSNTPLAPRSSSLKAAKKDKFKQNLRKLAATGEEDTRDTIDLGRTAEENAQRSGLAVTTSSSTASPAINNFESRRAHPHHVRTHSETSQASSFSGFFQPTGTAGLISHSPKLRPFTPPSLPEGYSVSSGNASAFDYGTEVQRVLEAGAQGAPRSTRSNSQPLRPPLRVETSYATAVESISSADATMPSHTGSAKFTRQRRGTNQSTTSNLSTVTPTMSRSPTVDRAFTFGRGSGRDVNSVDAVARAASIQAARRAFEEKEEAKTKKYEQKRARKNSAASKRSRSNTVGSKGKEEGEGAGLGLSAGLPYEATQPGDAAVASSLDQSRASKWQDEGSASAKPATSGRRTFKSTLLRFITWFRVRLLHMGMGSKH